MGWNRNTSWKKRIVSLALTVIIGAGAFTASPVTAQAANVIAKGVDVSKYQEAVNWSAVAADGYSFAFVKVGSAKSGLDPYFAANMVGAAAAGLKTGVYLYSYATTVEAAIMEAQFTIAAIQNYQVNMPVVFDLEDTVHRSMTPDQLAALAIAFCSVVEQAGYYPMVYSSRNWMVERIGPTPYDKWVAQYGPACQYPNPAFWQYSSSGSVAGIAGRSDVNFQFKDYSKIIIPSGFTSRDGKTYFYANYRKQFGWVDYADNRYYLNPADGSLYTAGWMSDGVNTFFMDTKDGHMYRGLNSIAGKNYYFDVNGLMQKGYVIMNALTYLFGADGSMHYGWYTDPAGGNRFFQKDGSMAFNTPLTIAGKNYFFDANGFMQTGLVNVAGLTYLYGADGSMQYGWYSDASGRRYFQKDGTMAFNAPLTIDGKNYYFDVNGIMQTGMVNVAGVTYLYGADGSMQYGWYSDTKGVRYFQKDGTMIANTTMVIEGKNFIFDASGYATEVVAQNVDLSGVDPSGWVYDAATGTMTDSKTGLVVDPAIVNAVLAQAKGAK